MMSAGIVGKGLGLLAKGFKTNPLLSSATSVFVGNEVLRPISKGIEGSVTGDSFEQELRNYEKERVTVATIRARQERIQRGMMQQMARIAALDPHLYNELLHGDALPRGAVVLGGRPKTDLLEQVAYQMTTGGIRQPTTAEDDLLATLAE